MLEFANRRLKRIRWNRSDVAGFLGCLLSRPKDNVVFRGKSGTAGLRNRIAVLDPKTQLLYLGARFFINGESFRPRPAQRATLARLADRRREPGRKLVRAGLEPLILDWRRSGFLRLEPLP